jgi:hypothetical protein
MAGSADSRTAAAHPRVAEYLRQLDTTLRRVPAGRAAELREQITTHIEDALAPGASDQEVAEVLASLGRPADLAAEAVAIAGKRPWPARVGWQIWTLITVVILAIAAVISYRAVMLSAAPIEADGGYTWLYSQDSSRQVNVQTDHGAELTVPVRPGQVQGIVVQFVNRSSQTQTVLGLVSNRSPACSTLHLSVSPEDPDKLVFPPSSAAAHYSQHGSIPPNQSRILRVLWTSARGCVGYGATAYFDQLTLRVRVGLLTRTEVVPLPAAFDLTGTK